MANLIDIILEDLKTHREGIFSQGFWAVFIYRFGHRRHSCRGRVLKKIWFVFYYILHKGCEIFFGISIAEKAIIGRRLNIEHFGGIFIHSRAVIGNDCMIRQGVTIGNKSKNRPLEAPKIGNNVDIGAGAKLLGGIVIGDNVSIGANAVVVKDIPSNCIAVGVPARVIKLNGYER